jgi:hypothetical protein
VRYFYVRVYNDGNATNRLVIKGSAAPPRTSVRYYAGSTDITAKMRSAAGYAITLAAGRYRQVKVKITIRARAAIGTAKTVAVTGAITRDGTRKDVVKATVRVVR